MSRIYWRPGYSFQFTKMIDQAKAETMARALYKECRGGLADWNRLTSANKLRWLRAARFAIEKGVGAAMSETTCAWCDGPMGEVTYDGLCCSSECADRLEAHQPDDGL